MVELEEYAALSDGELDRRLGAALQDGDVNAKRTLLQERERRTLQPLADAEARRRAKAARAAEAEMLLKRLVDMRDDLHARSVEVLDRLSRTAQSEARSVAEEAYTLRRQWYAISNDLEGATGDRRFATRYDSLDQIELHGGRVGKAFADSVRATTSPTVPTPWREDITKLIQLKKEG